MENLQNCLEIKNLNVYFETPEGLMHAVNDVSFHIQKGETLALVGESGCGKTVTSLSIMGLTEKNARVTADTLLLNGKDCSRVKEQEMRAIRGREVSMIFQEPMTALNPSLRIERQIGEMYSAHFPNLTKTEIREKSIEMLHMVGVTSPEERLKAFPHQLSGGLRQRVIIAIALASNAPLLIADEPTTALDVTIQAQILKLLHDLQQKLDLSLLLITHDFAVVSQIADRVAVMYAGQIVEEGDRSSVFGNPLHPYTEQLMKAIPGINSVHGEKLATIPGSVPSPLNYPKGCRFQNRCKYAFARCAEEMPPEYWKDGRRVRCYYKVNVHE